MTPALPAPPPGLCGACAHVRVVETRTGSRFHRCGLSDLDSRFPRYPRLPVLRCVGFRPAEPRGAGGPADPYPPAPSPACGRGGVDRRAPADDR